MIDVTEEERLAQRREEAGYLCYGVEGLSWLVGRLEPGAYLNGGFWLRATKAELDSCESLVDKNFGLEVCAGVVLGSVITVAFRPGNPHKMY